MDLRTLSLLKIFLFIIFGSKMLAFGFATNLQSERKCKYSRVNRLSTVRCYYMDLREVPQYLKSSIEVLDLSFNRIRKLKSNSFEKYTDLQFLLLYENMIQSVESGTFEPLTSLQEIDLSNNGLLTIPLELFQLPKLRNLYVDSNDLQFLAHDLEALEKPIKAPLEYLNIANCELKNLPDLGVLPHLWQINASSNPMTDLKIERFGYMCNLKIIDLTKSEMSQCICQQINYHLSILGAEKKYVPVCIDTLDSKECPMPYNQTVGSEAFISCQNQATIEEARSLWIFGAGCFGGSILVLLLVWYCVYRHRKNRAKRRLIREMQKRKHLVISPKNAMNNNLAHNHHHPQAIANSHQNNHRSSSRQSQREREERENELLRCDTA